MRADARPVPPPRGPCPRAGGLPAPGARRLLGERSGGTHRGSRGDAVERVGRGEDDRSRRPHVHGRGDRRRADDPRRRGGGPHPPGRVHGRRRDDAAGCAGGAHGRHPRPHRLDHQDDDLRGDAAAGTGGEAAAHRSRVEVRPGCAERREHHGRPAADDAQRPVRLHERPRLRGHPRRRPGEDLDAAGGAGHRLPVPPVVPARRRLRLQQHQLRPPRPHRREGRRQAAEPGVPGPPVRPAGSGPDQPPGDHGHLDPRTLLPWLPVRRLRVRPRGDALPARDGGRGSGGHPGARRLHPPELVLRHGGRRSHLDRRRPRDLDAGAGRRPGVRRRPPAAVAGQPAALRPVAAGRDAVRAGHRAADPRAERPALLPLRRDAGLQRLRRLRPGQPGDDRDLEQPDGGARRPADGERVADEGGRARSTSCRRGDARRADRRQATSRTNTTPSMEPRCAGSSGA